MNIRILEKTAYILRMHVLNMIAPGYRGHYGGSLSSAEIITALYFHTMKHFPADPDNNDRDRFILSKGHASPILYAALGEAGYFDKKHFKTLKELGSILQGHPDITKTPGVEANTGSLGQGLSIGLGMALALHLDNKPNKVYVLMGDGEMGEGQVWEAAMVAAHYKTDNLIALLDHNKIQATGFTRDRIDTGCLPEKWRAFGWHTLEIDGHDMKAIVSALNEACQVRAKPVMIVAHTVKGKGISFAENRAAFHNNLMTKEQWNQAMGELNAKIEMYG